MAIIRRAGHALYVLCAILLMTGLPASSAATPEIRIIESRADSFSPYPDVPGAFRLRGVVNDQDGRPLPGASIQVSGRGPSLLTDDRGRFNMKETLPARAMVIVSHPDAVTVRREARSLFSGKDGLSVIVLPRYTDSFSVTPGGGVYRARSMTLDVPKGAVSAPVTVRAVMLPPDLAYDDGDGPQLRRMAAVALAPEGLKFARPVRLRVPNSDSADLPKGDVPLLFDEKTGRYAAAPDVSVQRDDGHTIFTLAHFSRYASGNPAEGMERRLVRITTDLNGDGKTTTQDAEFVVILSGGDHGAEWVKSTGSSASVLRTTGRSSSSSTTDTKGASAGVSFGGVGVEVSGEVSSTEAQDASSAVGNGTTGSASQTAEFTLATPEYETDCAYLLRWYEYWRVRKWSRHTPGDKEAPGLQSAYNGRADISSDWGYFDIVGSTSIAVGRTVYGGDKIAVRKTANGWEYYRLAAEYLVRVPKGLHTLECKVGKPNEKVSADGPDAARFFTGGGDMASAAFDGSSTTRYLGWGVLPDSLPERYTNMECRRETSGEITIATETEEASEATIQRTSGKSTTVKAEGKVEIPVVGVEVGGGVSAAKSKESARGSSVSYAKKFTNQVSTTIKWMINDPHKPVLVHWSDHELHKLHLLLENRNWRLAPDSSIPKAVRDAAGKGAGRSYVGTAGGGMVMRDVDGAFLVSGPPVITQKEIGFMLVRTEQRPCPGATTTRGLDESSGDDDGGNNDEAGTQTPDRRASGDRRTEPPPKPVITPGPGAYHPASQQNAPDHGGMESRVYTPRGNMENYTAVPFTALDTETVIDRRAIGDVQSVTFVALDGKRMADKEREAKVTTADEQVTVDAGDAVGVASIIIGGSAGSVELFKPKRTAPPPAIKGPRPTLSIQDGDLDIRNGMIRETVRVPDMFTDISVPPTWHQVSINNHPVDTLAARRGELAVTGRDVPMPSGGKSTVQIRAPDGGIVQGQVASWGFRVDVQPVTFVGQTVPVMFQLQGVGDSERVLVELMPGPAQTVTPTRVTLSGAQLIGGVHPIARLTAQVPGQQVLNVRVTRLDAPESAAP